MGDTAKLDLGWAEDVSKRVKATLLFRADIQQPQAARPLAARRAVTAARVPEPRLAWA